MGRKVKEPLTEEILINWWLTKYFNTTLAEVFAEHPDWDSHKFYSSFRVTQAQHDEWNEWAKKRFKEFFHLTDKGVNRSWGFTYLNTAPMVREDK